MHLKLKKYIAPPKTLDKHIEDIMKSPGRYLTETQLAEILGLTIKKAVIRAAELKFSRIHVQKTRCYSKKQILAYLTK